MVYLVHIKENKTLCLPTEEECRHATSKYNELRYIERILYDPEETPIYPNGLINNGCVKPFHQGRLDLENVLRSYYENPCLTRVRQLRIRGIPIKFR